MAIVRTYQPNAYDPYADFCRQYGCIEPTISGSKYCAGHISFQEKKDLEAIVGPAQAKAIRAYQPTIVQDPVVEANRKMLLDRSVAGIQKYGTTLYGNKLSHRQWLQHALEEALDLANYLQAEIMKLDTEAADHKNTK